MNYSILADIELNRKISLFQKAVEAYVLNELSKTLWHWLKRKPI